MTRKIFIVIVVWVFPVLLMADESIGQDHKKIVVSAAISLKDAFEEIGNTFMKRHPGTKVLFNFGGSGDLARQIEAGAPVDIFASAAQKDMDDLAKKDLIAPHSRKNFAKNGVVLVKPARSGISLQSLQDLQRMEVRKVAIGNPKTVPAGRYAEEGLRHFKLWDVIQDKLVFGENVRQVLDYVARNEVDAGLVYLTDAMARSKEARVVMKLPEGSHQPVICPIGVIKGTRNESLSRQFVDFVISTEGQSILSQYGFITAGPSM
ncbi:MAG: molybdate ABC transporter substrate-binding protein [Thermodesulfobacteriota bacterium]